MAAKRISSLSVVLGASVAPFTKAFAGVRSTIGGFTSSITSAGSTLLKFTGIGAAIGGALAAFGGLKSGISLAAELEQNATAFETMLGSMGAAKALMADLTTFSAATPFEFPEIASSAKKLLAFGVGAADMTNKLTMLGDIAAGIGAPLEDIAAIYGKIKSRGQLTGETLNQMAERGIPIYRALAASLGVAESEIAGMVTKGKIGFAEVDSALAGLTKTGGQFSGMMAKQSKTLAGLWSTLTDNIGLAMAGVVTTIVDAFNIRGALSGLTSAIGSFGGWLTATVQRWAPVVLGVMQWIWSGVVAVWNQIYAAVAPIVTSIYDYVATNWQSLLATSIGYYTAIYNAISSALGAVWSIISSIGSAIASAWTWAMDVLGLSTTNASTTTGGAVETMFGWWQWAIEGITTGLNILAWSLDNFGLLVKFVATGAAYQVVKLGNQFVYFFTDVIPGVLSWFATNWRDIFTTIYNFYASVWTNIGKNLANFAKSLWSFLKGDGFNFKWTGLLEGFENTVKEMPKIAERQIGPLEKSLGDSTAAMGEKIGTGLSDYLTAQERAAKDTAGNIAGWLDKTLEQKPIETPQPQAPKPIPVTADTSQIEEALGGVEQQAKETAASIGLIVAGSAEAQQLAAQAAFQAASIGSSTTAPVPAEVRKDVRDAVRKSDQTGAAADPVPALLRELIAAVKDGSILREAS